MKKRVIIISVTVVAIAIVLFLIFRPKGDVAIGYQTADIYKGKIANSVTATGTIEPLIQVEVGTQVSGKITRIYVDYNSKVKKGQILAELEKTTLEAELSSSDATRESAKTEFEYQQKNYLRLSALYEKKLISDTDYETAKYQYDKAKSAYDKAKSDITRVRQNLQYATIYSPIDGVVLNRAVDEGQTVAASFNTPTLFTIANDLTRMQVIADVDEADIGDVKEGQKVTFIVDAFPEDLFNGSVTQVRLQPTTTSNVVTYEVVVDAPNPSLKLKPGLTANITIITLEKSNILLVPNKALRFTPVNMPVVSQSSASDSSGGKQIWIKTTSGIAPVRVNIGASDGIHTEVFGDVKEGDKVVIGVTQNVTPANSSSGDSGRSPFMPSRPGQKK
ncbi:MAG: efflux RND transporter periplasmic adaptor subunit [Rikenellaceae bacterium]